MRVLLTLLIGVLAMGCGRMLPSIVPSSSAKPHGPAPAVAAALPDVQAICEHRWWKTKPTVEQVNQLIGRVCILQRKNLAFIDDTGRLEVVSLHGGNYFINEDAGAHFLVPESMIRYIYLDMTVHVVRPKPDDIAAIIKFKLDAAEFSESK